MSTVDQNVLRKHQLRMNGTHPELLSAVDLHNKIMKEQQSKMVQEARIKASS